MPYSVAADIYRQVDETIVLHCADGDTLTVDSAIEQADSEIDSYLQKRYEVPIPVDQRQPILLKLSVDIALYNLISRKGFDEDQADVIIEKRYKMAIDLLKARIGRESYLQVKDVVERLNLSREKVEMLPQETIEEVWRDAKI